MRNFCIVLIAALWLAQAPALAHLTKPAKRDRETQQVLYEAGKYLEKKNSTKALDVLRPYMAKHPDASDPMIWYALGNARYLGGQPRAAYDAWKKGYGLDPSSFPLCVNLARTALDLKRFAEAGDLLEKAFSLSRPKKSELLYQSAVALYHGGKYSRARKVLDRFFQSRKSAENDPLQLYIQICIEMKDWEAAEDKLRLFLDKNPQDAAWWELLAQVRSSRGDHRGATAALEILYRLKPPSSKEWEQMADRYFYLNLPLRAAHCLERAWGKHPGPAQCDRLAAAYAQAQQTGRALDYLDQAIAQAPTGKRFLEKGKLYYERGQWKTALVSLKKAVQAAPDLALAHLLIGYCALETGDDNLARTAFSAAAKEKKYYKEANAGLVFLGE